MDKDECQCKCGHIHYSGIECPMCRIDKEDKVHDEAHEEANFMNDMFDSKIL